MNASTLASSCESQMFHMTAASNEAETSKSSARIVIFFFIICNFEVFSIILILEKKCDCSPHKSALSCLCYMFSVTCLGTFMLLPVSHGVCSQFISYLVQLVSPLYIYSPSVSLVLCELLNVMVVCLPIILFFVPFGFWLIVCSSFSMKCLHIDPCLCLLLHNITVFDWNVSLTSASLSLYLV